MTRNDKWRITLDMPEALRKRLGRVQKESHAPSMSDVFRRSVALYEYCHRVKKDGGVIVARFGDKTEREVELL